jgi:hypothetical protein
MKINITLFEWNWNSTHKSLFVCRIESDPWVGSLIQIEYKYNSLLEQYDWTFDFIFSRKIWLLLLKKLDKSF